MNPVRLIIYRQRAFRQGRHRSGESSTSSETAQQSDVSLPELWGCHDLIKVLVDDRLADLTDDDGDRVCRNSPPKLHVSILGSSRQMTEGDGQLQARGAL